MNRDASKPARTARDGPEISTLHELLGGLLSLSPLDIIPGIPTLIALAVLIVCVQLLAATALLVTGVATQAVDHDPEIPSSAHVAASSSRWRCR